MKKTRRTKTPKSDKSETPEASQRVRDSWGNPAERTTRSVLGCKGCPRIVPGVLRTPFSSILATKTMHCTSVLTDAQPTRFPNKYMPSFPLSSFKTTLLPIRFETWQAHDVYLRSRCYDMSYILYNMNHNIYIYIYTLIYIICTYYNVSGFQMSAQSPKHWRGGTQACLLNIYILKNIYIVGYI